LGRQVINVLKNDDSALDRFNGLWIKLILLTSLHKISTEISHKRRLLTNKHECKVALSSVVLNVQELHISSQLKVLEGSFYLRLK
jgi:hypothetical protein